MTDDKVKEAVELLRRAATPHPADGPLTCAVVSRQGLSNLIADYDIAQAERDKLSAEVEAVRGQLAHFALVEPTDSLQADVRDTFQALAATAQRFLADSLADKAKLTALVEDMRRMDELCGAGIFPDPLGFLAQIQAVARQALAHHSAPVGEDQTEAQWAYIEAVALEFGRELPGDAWHLYRQQGLTPVQAAAEHRRIVSAPTPPTTPTSAPVEDVGGLVEPDRWRREKFDAALDRITRKAIAVTQERVCAAMAALAEPGAEDTGLTLFESVMDHPEAELASAPALIMAAIEEVPNWGDSTALVTAHCHAYVLHNDLPDRLAALSPSLIQPQPADDNHKALVEEPSRCSKAEDGGHVWSENGVYCCRCGERRVGENIARIVREAIWEARDLFLSRKRDNHTLIGDIMNRTTDALISEMHPQLPTDAPLIEALRKVDHWLLTVPEPGTEGATWLLGEVRQALASAQPDQQAASAAATNNEAPAHD